MRQESKGQGRSDIDRNCVGFSISINHHHYTDRACLAHKKQKAEHKQKQTGMKSLMKVF